MWTWSISLPLVWEIHPLSLQDKSCKHYDISWLYTRNVYVFYLSLDRACQWEMSRSSNRIWLESISIDIAQNMMYAISRIHNGRKVVVCFGHDTPSHYHHDAWLLACVEHKNACRVYHVASVSKMGLVLSITFLYITGPFEFRWLKEYSHNPSYYHHQIGSIHLSHCCHIFPWLCVWDGCTIIFCHLLHIYPGNTGTLFPLLMFSLWYMQTIGYIMTCRPCSFVCRLHHLIIIIMQTYLKALNY